MFQASWRRVRWVLRELYGVRKQRLVGGSATTFYWVNYKYDSGTVIIKIIFLNTVRPIIALNHCTNQYCRWRIFHCNAFATSWEACSQAAVTSALTTCSNNNEYFSVHMLLTQPKYIVFTIFGSSERQQVVSMEGWTWGGGLDLGYQNQQNFRRGTQTHFRNLLEAIHRWCSSQESLVELP